MVSLGLNSTLLNGVLFFQNSNGNGDKANNVVAGAFMVTVLILLLGLYYKITLERAKDYKRLPKIVFLVFLMIRWIKKTTIEMLGRRYSFAIPFFIYIVFYFWGTSLVGMLGFQGISAIAFVPMSIAAIVFVGTVASGIAAKGWGFCKDYYVWFRLGKKKVFPIPDVLKMLGEAGKVISLGLRLWGNYFAGAIVLFMVKHFLSDTIGQSITSNVTLQSFLFPLHLYFDIVDGALHSMIFLILTFSYWSMAKQVETK